MVHAYVVVLPLDWHLQVQVSTEIEVQESSIHGKKNNAAVISSFTQRPNHVQNVRGNPTMPTHKPTNIINRQS